MPRNKLFGLWVSALMAVALLAAACSSPAAPAPTAAPKEVVNILSAAMKKAMEDQDQQKRLDDVGLLMRYMDADQAAQLWADNEAKAKALVEQSTKER